MARRVTKSTVLRRLRPEQLGRTDGGRLRGVGVLMFTRYAGASYTLVALNIGEADQTMPFWFPVAGDYVEELDGRALDLGGVVSLQATSLTIRSHYGRIWTTV